MQDVRIALGLFLDQVPAPLYVQNVTGAGKNSIVTYQVRMGSVEQSKKIRSTFSGFFTGGKDTRPPALKTVSIRNRVSKATPVRRDLLRLFGERYQESNPGSQFKVLGYDPRPLLKIFPASDASNRRTQTYNYVEAIRSLPTNFSQAELKETLVRVSPKLKGKIKLIFGIIDDDMVRLATRGRARNEAAPRDPAIDEEEEEDSSEETPSQHSSNTRKRGASSDLSGAAKSAKGGRSGKSNKSGRN